MSRVARSLMLVTMLAGMAAVSSPLEVNARTVAPPTESERAAALEARAEKLLGVSEQWRTAARLLQEAAALRVAGDALGVQDLMLAAAAWYHSGKQEQAQATYVAAGERALADGDVEGAARGFLLAGTIANERRDGAAVALLARAERLASSPLLNEAQRRTILERIGSGT